jgi:hypothetical protein
MMRFRLRSAVSLGVSFSAIVAGCTFLVPFDDVPDGADAALDVRGRDRRVDVADEGEDGGGGLDAGTNSASWAPPCDPDFPLGDIQCPEVPGRTHFCARALPSYPDGRDRDNDLVRCELGGARCVQHCPYGCIVTRPGFDHQCDPCNGLGDGFYCGHDFPGSPTRNADLAIRCVGGKNADAAVCGDNRCASPCSRPGGPQPSCCI